VRKNKRFGFENIQPYITLGKDTETKEERRLTSSLFINFSFTDLLVRCIQQLSIPGVELVNIHGLLDETSNPIILGDGDDTSEEYFAFEVADNDELLIKIKSHSY
jgi:hypothetical protein